jgi:hypothetical protein
MRFEGVRELFLPGGDLLDRPSQGDHRHGADDEVDDHVHHVHHHDDGFILQHGQSTNQRCTTSKQESEM